MNKISKKHDIVIIGAGIGGLICGCYLAKAGLKVLLLEQNDKAGGCCVSFKRKGVRFDAGAHIFGSCNERGVLAHILKNIEVKQRFIRLNPTDRFFFAQDEIVITQDIHEYFLLLRNNFPNEKESIHAFFNEFINIIRNIKSSYKKYGQSTYQDILNKYFHDKKLHAILSAQAGFMGVIPKNISVAGMCAMLGSYLKDGAFYPLGGSGHFADSLVSAFLSFGGELIFNAKADKFIMKKDKIDHLIVMIDNKMCDIRGDKIVSNIDIIRTFFELMNRESITSVIEKNISKSKATPPVFYLYLAAKIDKSLIKNKVGWYYPDYNVNDSFDKCVYLTSPSLYDDTASQKGLTVLQAGEFFMEPYDTVSDWGSVKKQYEDRLLAKLFRFIPELKDTISIKESASPKTFERYTGNTNGSAYGWQMTPDQYSTNEIIKNEALRYNLYLTGHWTNPGGGILGTSISGYATAKKIISDLAIN